MIEYAIYWREYYGAKTAEFVFPGVYSIGSAIAQAAAFRQVFARSGRAIEFWVQPL